MAEQTLTDQEIQYDIYQPFGPSILKVKMPQGYVNLLNTQADSILFDEKLSEERDWSHNLAGNVKKEVAINHNEIEGFSQFLVTMAHEYIKRVLPEGLSDKAQVSFSVWVVSQVAGDLSLIHISEPTRPY